MSAKQEVDINFKILVEQVTADSKEPRIHESKEKIKVSLTVGQLAYIFKMLMDLKVIKTSNLSKLMRFVVENVSTPKADNISFDSFKAKFYNTERSAIKYTKDLIIKQLNYVNKDIGSDN